MNIVDSQNECNLFASPFIESMQLNYTQYTSHANFHQYGQQGSISLWGLFLIK